MDNFTLSTTTTKATSILNSSAVQSLCLKQSKHFTFAKKPRKISVLTKKPRNFSVFAAKDESQIDQWDQMELKFGRMIGEDPKLTLAKIMGRKSDPEVSYMEIEKNFERNKGKKVYDIEEVPFNVSDEKKSSNSLDGLNLVRPVPKKGVKFEVDNKPPSQLSRPSQPSQPGVKSFENVKSNVPNVILRKPSLYNEDDEDLSRVRIKPNVSLTIGKVTPERFTDMTLLKRPEPATIKPEEKPEAKENEESKYTLLEKPSTSNEQEEEIVSTIKSEENVLLGKPQRLEQLEKATQNINTKDEIPITPEIHDNAIALTNFLTSPQLKEHEDNDWNKAEELVKTGGREEVELISSSTRGFAVSFGSLIGFLPYRNLGAKWKFLAFESWLRKKGLDPSVYRQNLGVIGTFDSTSTIPSLESRLDPQKDDKTDQEISSDMKLDELFVIYDQEKLKFLSSFIGQRIKVSVVLADRIFRKLIFSTKPKEKEEILGKKRALMAKLSVGDVVKCCIKKITYFGIFVEIEGVPALIHQTEVSWDATLDPASYFKIGQIIEAKVHQLDFSLERIFLSLKEITPDPLMETLEAVVGEHAFDGELEAAQETDTEWVEVESLIQELQQFKGIQSVSKGRYFLSPGLAPTFQVYMAAMFEDQYKLLARSGNRIQEVMVQTSLSKEEIKSAILTCTSRVV